MSVDTERYRLCIQCLNEAKAYPANGYLGKKIDLIIGLMKGDIERGGRWAGLNFWQSEYIRLDGYIDRTVCKNCPYVLEHLMLEL